MLVSRFLDFGEIWNLAHAFRHRSEHLGIYFFNEIVLVPQIIDFITIWLLAHACKLWSKRLGAYFLRPVNALWWYFDYEISGRFGSWLMPVGLGVSA